jgi:UDP:flavonoid glycosyltransferase YjiC (YdhE family)
MLVVPFSWDQPDNAERVRRLGIARTIPKRRFTAKTAAAALRRLLDDRAYSRQAAAVAHQMEQEDGVSVACDAIEALLIKSSSHLNK